NVYFAQEKHKKAREKWQEALEMIKRTLGETNVDVAHYLGAIGHTWYREKKYKKALTVYEEALVIFRANLAEDHEFVKNCKDWIASAHAGMK
ncbi:MAG: tetratricopeptide repeat protein, partial [Deltaproteobacteria bacterium]|nr:tetratricopeptide repeat protein [Deltaproteobacteria bacterium]